MWNKQTISKHIKAAQILERIKNDAFRFIAEHPDTNEWEVKEFLLDQYRQNKLASKPRTPIVAFGPSADDPHYFPIKKKARKLKKNTLIMIDIWAALREKHAPYADITWMGFYGNKVPKTTQKIMDVVFKARDNALKFLAKELKQGRLPEGREIDAAAMKVLIDAGYKKGIKHTTGHAIGFTNPHGKPIRSINYKDKKNIKTNIAYTIEPGIYIDGKLGVRSEIDFYVDENLKLHITTRVQNKLVKIST